ncbi:hypothetical protein CENTIMANUS_00320 [Klebsiella phage vB_KpM_Centimanus]
MLTTILDGEDQSFMIDLNDIKFVGPAWPEDRNDYAFFKVLFYSGGELRIGFKNTQTMLNARNNLMLKLTEIGENEKK